MTILAFTLRRLALLTLVLLAVSIITFAIVNVLPGDVATAILGDMATPGQVEAVRTRLGLDQPVVTRYAQWIVGILHGDLGRSLQYGTPIAPMLLARLGNSAILGAIILAIAAPLSIILGTLAALRPGRWLDRSISALAVGAYALPEYVTGLALILAFSIWWPLLPGSSLIDPNDNPLQHPDALVLPVAVMVIGMLAYISQITRASMIQVMQSAYIRTAILKGASPWRVVTRHAMPNLLPPVVTEIGMYVGYVIGGLVVVESLFSYAGLGAMLTNAVSYRDVPIIQSTVLLVATAYGIGNLLADVAALMLTPRLRT